MIISDNNKAAFFEVQLTYSKMEINQQLLEEKITIQMDLLFEAVNAREIYKFNTKNHDKSKKKHITYFFGTQTRKRKSQILKYLEDFIKEEIEKAFIEVPYNKENFSVRYRVMPLLKSRFFDRIRNRLENKNTKFFSRELLFSKKLYNPRKELIYKGEDLQIFDDKKNWHPWQLELSEKIFYQTGEIRRANYQRAIYLWDPEGSSGKSTFYKFLIYKYYSEKSITYLRMGVANELISALAKCSNKKLYICDLSKLLTLTDKSTLYSLFARVENLKNGIICNHRHENYDLQLFFNPHVILSSNQLVSPQSLSKDEWIIYQINEKLELVDVTKNADELFRKQEEEKHNQNFLPTSNIVKVNGTDNTSVKSL